MSGGRQPYQKNIASCPSAPKPSSQTTTSGLLSRFKSKFHSLSLGYFVKEDAYQGSYASAKADPATPLPSAPPPGGVRSTSFKRKGQNDMRSFHTVNKVEMNGKNYYEKVNLPGSLMSALEAFGANLARNFAPQYFPKTYAIYNEDNQYTGVLSKNLKTFKSVDADPLTKKDFPITCLPEKLTQENQARAYQTIRHLEALDQYRSKKAKRNKGKVENKSNTIDAEEFEILKHFGNDPNLEKNLENYRTQKALIHIFTISLFCAEDDLHRKNLGKRARIDFDMILWVIYYHFKEGNIIDPYLRSPSSDKSWYQRLLKWKTCAENNPETRFHVTQENLRTLPVLDDPQGAKPYYCAATAPTAPGFLSSSNDYTSEEAELYKALKDLPVVNYHKFACLLRIILTNPNEYLNLTDIHIPNIKLNGTQDPAVYKNKKLRDILIQFLTNQTKHFKKLLLDMPEFETFLESEGDFVVEQICKEMQERNDKTNNKIVRYSLALDNLREQKKTLNQSETDPQAGIQGLNEAELQAKIVYFRKQLVNTSWVKEEYQKLKEAKAKEKPILNIKDENIRVSKATDSKKDEGPSSNINAPSQTIDLSKMVFTDYSKEQEQKPITTIETTVKKQEPVIKPTAITPPILQATPVKSGFFGSFWNSTPQVASMQTAQAALQKNASSTPTYQNS